MAPSWMSRALNAGYPRDTHKAEFCARHALRAGRANRTLPCDHMLPIHFSRKLSPPHLLIFVLSHKRLFNRPPPAPAQHQPARSSGAVHTACKASTRCQRSIRTLLSPCSPAKRKPRLWLPLC